MTLYDIPFNSSHLAITCMNVMFILLMYSAYRTSLYIDRILSIVGMEAISKHDYQATADDELSFAKGSKLKVVDHTVYLSST